jgi:hypothetical protein
MQKHCNTQINQKAKIVGIFAWVQSGKKSTQFLAEKKIFLKFQKIDLGSGWG